MSDYEEISDVAQERSKNLCKNLVYETEKWLSINTKQVARNQVKLMDEDIDVLINAAINFSAQVLSKTLHGMQQEHPDDEEFYARMIMQLVQHLARATAEGIGQRERGEMASEH